jgi:spore coat protein CotF
MAKLTVTLKLDMANPPNEDTLKLLCRDALGEFIDQREPVSEYMAKRGYTAETYSMKFLAEKAVQIANRIRWAKALSLAMSNAKVTTPKNRRSVAQKKGS